jgi:glutamine amidotransferase
VRIGVVDYGVGNLLSVSRALAAVGAQPELVATPEQLADVDRLVLPGVGAFGPAMAALEAQNLVAPIRAHVAAGKPFLGICLGMQLMMETSEEFGKHLGLGLIPGKVKAIPQRTLAGGPLRIPHVGWAAIRPCGDADWSETGFASVAPGAAVYFVHSFAANPDWESDALACCEYGGHRIVAAIARGAAAGCQFHPEKSGPVGLAILRDFVNG